MKKYIKGRSIKFKDKVATEFYKKIINKWEKLLEGKRNIIILPCASRKPIQMSRTHCYLSPITRWFDDANLVIIISEPLTFIPYLEKIYPNYEYKPENLLKNDEERVLFTDRLKNLYSLKQVIEKQKNQVIKTYYIGGYHHKNILINSGWEFKFFHPKNGIIDYKNTALKLYKNITGNSKQIRNIKFNLVNITKDLVIINYLITD